MNNKKYSVKTRSKIQTILGWVGVLVSMAGFMMGGQYKEILPLVGLGIVLLAVIYRMTMVRCPYCSNRLLGGSGVPDKCPECHQELD